MKLIELCGRSWITIALAGALVVACANTPSSPNGDGDAGALSGLPKPGDSGTDSASTACGLSVPADAVAAVSIKFDNFDVGRSEDAWRSIGFDRDGLCTTESSNDVCMRVGGANRAKQEDGQQGIDNSWGRSVNGYLTGLGSTNGPGHLTTDANGDGVLTLTIDRGRMEVPVKYMRVHRRSGSATISAIVPTDRLIVAFRKFAAQLNPQLCEDSSLDVFVQTLKQASDILSDGTQDPALPCDAISLGADLTGVIDAPPPAPNEEASCP